jgi:hypothetical protein
MLDIYRLRNGGRNEELPQALLNTANAYSVAGRRSDADRTYQESIRAVGLVYPKDHPMAASVLENYAWALRHWGRTREAASLQKEAKAIRSHRPNSAGSSVDVSELAVLR